jgi:hypothetical protein
MNFRRIVISLPFFLCATPFVHPLSLAQAAGMDATQATVLLAKSRAIDAKCAVLTKDQSQDLKDFVAQAEISLAEKNSVAVARKTIADGRAAGQSTTCDATASKLVNDVLTAAKTATATPVDDTTTKVAAQKPTLIPMAAAPAPQAKAIIVKEAVTPSPPKKTAVVVKVQNPKIQVAEVKIEQPAKMLKPLKETKSVKGLGSYSAVAEKYYLATRCGSMSASEISRLYKTVLSNHQQALASNRPADVRAMLLAAQSRSKTKSCG